MSLRSLRHPVATVCTAMVAMSSFSANFLMWTAVRKLARRCGFALTRQRHVLSQRELDYGDAASQLILARFMRCHERIDGVQRLSIQVYLRLYIYHLSICLSIYLSLSMINNTFSLRPCENLPPKFRSSSWPVKEESKALEQSLEVHFFWFKYPKVFQTYSKRF